MPIYQGQPTALAAPIMPVEMVSVALADGVPSASTQQSVPMNCVSRDEAMAGPSEFLAALLKVAVVRVPCRFLWLATMRRSVWAPAPRHAAGERRGTNR